MQDFHPASMMIGSFRSLFYPAKGILYKHSFFAFRLRYTLLVLAFLLGAFLTLTRHDTRVLKQFSHTALDTDSGNYHASSNRRVLLQLALYFVLFAELIPTCFYATCHPWQVHLTRPFGRTYSSTFFRFSFRLPLVYRYSRPTRWNVRAWIDRLRA